MPTQVMVSLPVLAVNGADDGPEMWLSAAIHGDEINGVEIIRRVLDRLDPAELRGCIVAAPIVNVFGFSIHSRYLPDRRDLNRCFPGSAKGSLASRLARILMTEVVEPCSHGIDLHTAAAGRMNLPQLRCDLDDDETRRCAEAFGAPIAMHSDGPGGTLRRAAVRRGKKVLLYEAGEVLRFNPPAIEAGVDGVLRVMAALDMIEPHTVPAPTPMLASYKQRWVRAPRAGIVHMQVELGARVVRRQPLAMVCDPMGEHESPIRSPCDGYVIGGITNPLVNRGDAVLHIALVDGEEPATVEPPARLETGVDAAPQAMQLPEDAGNGRAAHGEESSSEGEDS